MAGLISKNICDNYIIKDIDNEIKKKEIEDEFLKRQKKSPDISICCLLSREQLITWCFYQIEKQRSYLKLKGITSEVLIITNLFYK